ncbi:hypothetical protein [Novosphingobium sp.]|uniref:DUF6950 family protein n=1 Tax=Novosphingobium sp. TaxID=1874826 RepID=UPI00262B5BB9|nr:hypothetical protein [Novosphingobium sp.]
MRKADWETALAEYLAGQGGAVFAWGERDCAMFAAGAVEAMTGIDPAAQIRGRYNSVTGAARVLKRAGADSLGAWVSARFAEVPPVFAHRGDLVMVDGSLGICAGAGAWFVGEDNGAPGLISRPMLEWDRAWRVPYTG